MPRTLSPTFLAQLGSAGASAPVFFVVLAFADHTLYLFSGIGTLTPAGPAYNPLSTFPYGETFTGLGWLGKLSAIPQTTKVQAQGVTLGLSGIPSNLVSEAVAQVRITGSATIFLGFFNLSTGALIGDPVQLFAGALDVPTLDDSGQTSTLSITAENPLIQLNEAPNRQFDDMDQQIYHPGDLGLGFLGALGNLALFWPAPIANAAVFAVDMIMSPNGADIGVGDTITIFTTINYSDTSFYTIPGPSGSGAPWLGGISSSNPKIATVNVFGVVTGISPGICLIIARAVYPDSSGGASAPSAEKRVACTIIVSSGDLGNILFGSFGSTPGGIRQITTPADSISQYGITSTDSVWVANGNQIVRSGGMCVDSSGNMYILDQGGAAIYKVPFGSGVAVRIAGTGTAGHSGDGGLATSAEVGILGDLQGIAVDGAGNVYFCDDNFTYVRAINMQSTTQTLLGVSIPAGFIAGVVGIAGSSGYSGDGGPATSAQLHSAVSLAFDSSGNLYIADSNNDTIRKVTPSGTISSFIGSGLSNQGHSGDGGAYASAQINDPTAICIDAAGNLYIFCNNVGTPAVLVESIATVTPVGADAVYLGPSVTGGIPPANLVGSGIVVTGLLPANNGSWTVVSVGGGGITLNNPAGTAQTGASGQLLVDGVPTVRVANLTASTQVCLGVSIPAGYIDSVAGLHPSGYGGDGGPALSARLGIDVGALAVDSQGNLYIADFNNKRIRVVSSTGTITTLAGIGTNGNTGNGGPAASAEIWIGNGMCFVAV